ncbi:hypothetical protein [Streptomyces sp. NPDC048202]|uniref:hypothetical protein n=1 Tax=Streptomyces sp. NPDC048202 TaxID=3365514 RepID=UPI00371CFF74
MPDVRPSQRMRDLGVVHRGAGILDEVARAFSLAAERDEYYEGCLSFFGVRGLVPRTLTIRPRPRPSPATGIVPIPVEEYRQTVQARAYERSRTRTGASPP